jgi:hypothetical protein
MVRIAPATSASVADSLGYSFVMAGAGQGILATVFADRVSALAHSARVDAGELLGRALAHEVGHMLLGRADHPSEGLMRGLWTVADLQRNHPHDWTWSRQERHDLRRALEIRTRGVATPVATLAD